MVMMELEIGLLVHNKFPPVLYAIIGISGDKICIKDAFGRTEVIDRNDCIPGKNGAGQMYVDGSITRKEHLTKLSH